MNLPAQQLQALTDRIQDAGTEVVKAKVRRCMHGPLSMLKMIAQSSCRRVAADVSAGDSRAAHLCRTLDAEAPALHDSDYMACLLQAGKGSATLSMAYAAAKFGEACLQAMAGMPGVVECAYVDSHLTDLSFFASQLKLGTAGVQVSTCLSLYCVCLCKQFRGIIAMKI